MLAIVSTSIVVFGCWIALLQYRVAHEKLRQDFFERRFAVFYTYQQLVLVVTGLSEDLDPKPFLQKAAVARAEAFFLFGPEIVPILDELYKEAFRLWKQPELMNTAGMYSSDNYAKEKAEAAMAFSSDRIAFTNKVAILQGAFDPYLRANEQLFKRPGHLRNFRS